MNFNLKRLMVGRLALIALLACWKFPVAPLQAQVVETYEESEDGAVRAFLKHQLSSKVPQPICFNTSLGRWDQADLNAFGLRPPSSNANSDQKNYAKDIKNVLEGDWKFLNYSRVVVTDAKEWREIGARPATFQDCENLASYRIGRVVIKKDMAIILAGLSFPCSSSTFGMSLKRESGVWVAKYQNGYYSVGVPGCRDDAKSNPGEKTDSFILLGSSA